jgi:putative restriction endonuclease
MRTFWLRFADLLRSLKPPAANTHSAEELQVRLAMWRRLHEAGGPQDVSKRLIRELSLYGGAQGVWVDAERTRSISGDGTGIAVGLLHTGRHYADDLSATGILYHYPRTNRPPGRDLAEIEATKRAGQLALPVFVVTPSAKSNQRRDVHLGWVADWDDADEIFLVTLTDDVTPPSIAPGGTPSAPFKLLDDDAATRRVEVAARPNQQKFKFDVRAPHTGERASTRAGSLPLPPRAARERTHR